MHACACLRMFVVSVIVNRSRFPLCVVDGRDRILFNIIIVIIVIIMIITGINLCYCKSKICPKIFGSHGENEYC